MPSRISNAFFTSTKTRASPARTTRSISPCLHRQGPQNGDRSGSSGLRRTGRVSAEALSARRHTDAVRWLDAYIDGIYNSSVMATSRPARAFGPFSIVGSIVNIVICSILVVAASVSVVLQPGAFAVALIGLPMLGVFVRIHARVRRGDFDVTAR